jgi:tetratricopeptide (TPR) repeat protein
MRDTDEDLGEIKREIIESRGLVIRTNNLTSALSADIKSIAKRQHGYERRITWNSAWAYVIFVILLFAGLKLSYDARLDQVSAKGEELRAENERLRKEAKESQKRDEDRARAEAKAAQFYDLIRQGKRADVVDSYANVKKDPLSRAEQLVFADAVEKAKGELMSELYVRGMAKMKIQRWQEASTTFEEALKLKEDASMAPEIRLHLAEAYRKLNRHEKAIPMLQALADNPVNKDIQDDALYMLAWCQMDTQSWNDSKESWRVLIKRFPDSHFTPEGKMQLAALNILH